MRLVSWLFLSEENVTWCIGVWLCHSEENVTWCTVVWLLMFHADENVTRRTAVTVPFQGLCNMVHSCVTFTGGSPYTNLAVAPNPLVPIQFRLNLKRFTSSPVKRWSRVTSDRHGKRKRLIIFLERMRKDHPQSDKYWNCFQSNIRKTKQYKLLGKLLRGEAECILDFLTAQTVMTLNWTQDSPTVKAFHHHNVLFN